MTEHQNDIDLLKPLTKPLTKLVARSVTKLVASSENELYSAKAELPRQKVEVRVTRLHTIHEENI